jgi:Ca2+-binding RTX toxin-like protein
MTGTSNLPVMRGGISALALAWSRSWVVLLAVPLAVLAFPSIAGAATARVIGSQAQQLVFDGAPGETNVVSIALVGDDGAKVRYSLRDSGAGIVAGPGCSGDPAPGAEVTCVVARSTPAPPCTTKPPCPTGLTVLFAFKLGDRDDVLDTTTVSGNDGGLSTNIEAGEGSDWLSTGATADTAHPGPGADHLSTGDGDDRVVAAEPAPDGPDYLDLGPGVDRAEYQPALAPIAVSLDGIANDGGPGEGDNVLDAEFVQTGSGDDLLVGSDREVREELAGGPGADTINGLAGDDAIHGGFEPFNPADDDLIVGGPGDDDIFAGSGEDDVTAGAGDDLVDVGPGDDRGTGGSGRDSLIGDLGADRLRGGAGSDRLDAAYDAPGRESRDRLDCGPGKDRARLERRDRVRRCERILYRSDYGRAEERPRLPSR